VLRQRQAGSLSSGGAGDAERQDRNRTAGQAEPQDRALSYMAAGQAECQDRALSSRRAGQYEMEQGRGEEQVGKSRHFFCAHFDLKNCYDSMLPDKLLEILKEKILKHVSYCMRTW
jgi:hypothetical protein